MDPWLANLVGAGCVLLVVLGIAAFAASIVAGIVRSSRRNRAFLDAALVSKDLPPGAEVVVAFQAAAGQPHAVWLDLSLSGKGELGFDVALAVRVGDKTVIDGTYPVRFDDENDAKGLPYATGITAMNTTGRTGLGGGRITTTLKAFLVEASPSATTAEVRARIVEAPGVKLDRSRLLVTVRDAP